MIHCSNFFFLSSFLSVLYCGHVILGFERLPVFVRKAPNHRDGRIHRDIWRGSYRGFGIHHAERPIVGLAENFEFKVSLDKVLRELQRQIPAFLSVPLSDEDMRLVYVANTTLTMGDKELVSSRDELQSLITASLLLSETTNRAARFFANFGDNLTSITSGHPVKATLYLNPDLTSVRVQWETNVLPFLGEDKQVSPTANPLSVIQGVSILSLDPTDGRVTKHKLLQVRWNGQVQNAKSIGSFLSTIRSSTKQVENSLSFFGSGSSVMQELRDDLVRQLVEDAPEIPLAPLVLANLTTNVTVNDTQPPPLPGTDEWPLYAKRHSYIQRFVETIIPVLAGDKEYADNFQSFFDSNAKIRTPDGNVLLQGSRRLGNYYQSLADLRKRTFGDWKLNNVEVVRWSNPVQILVNYTTETRIPGTKAATRLDGEDLYTLQDEKIQHVQQKRITIGDSSQDATLFIKTTAAAIDSGQLRADSANTAWLEIFKRFTSSRAATTNTLTPKRIEPVISPSLSDTAAAQVYRLMMSLHQDYADLVNVNSTSRGVPASKYLTDKVLLEGLLGEPIVKGKVNYERNVGITVASLRAALRSGRLRHTRQPDTKIELLASGEVQASVTLHLKFQAIGDLPSIGNISLPDGLPVKVFVVSKYVLDTESSRIVKHTITETQVNGQPTPGDIVGQWLKRTRGEGEKTTDQSLISLVDAVRWLQSSMSG